MNMCRDDSFFFFLFCKLVLFRSVLDSASLLTSTFFDRSSLLSFFLSLLLLFLVSCFLFLLVSFFLLRLPLNRSVQAHSKSLVILYHHSMGLFFKSKSHISQPIRKNCHVWMRLKFPSRAITASERKLVSKEIKLELDRF